jgi:hypothetical protein
LIDAYKIPYYSRGIEGEKWTRPRFADCITIVTVENKKMSKRKPNWTDREQFVLLEEYEKRMLF